MEDAIYTFHQPAVLGAESACMVAGLLASWPVGVVEGCVVSTEYALDVNS